VFDVQPGDIAELIQSGQFEEGVELEAKRASGNIPSDAWPTISAFANISGGVLILGLDETDDGWVPRGMPNQRQRIQDFLNQMRDPGKISFQAVRNDDVWTEDVNGERLVIVRVHPAPRTARPVYINGKRDEAYVRNGEGDARCTHAELDRMRREAAHHSADRQVLPYLDFSDFDMETVRRYREESRARRPSLPQHRLDDQQFLRKVEAWRRDMDAREEGPTLAGILMFGKEDAIREVRYPHVIDYRRVPTDNTPSRRWTDRERWTGNLYGAWESIFPRLIRGLPTPFRLRGPHRIDEPEGLETVREAFVNLLVHTDYKETRDAVIEHRDDRYMFRNPGDSWVVVENLGVEGRSERRNPVIAQMFDDLGLADQAGSGYLRIYDEWLALGYRKPSVHSDPLRYEFELELDLASMLPADDRSWLASFGERWKPEEEVALMFLRHDGRVDNQTLRSATGQHVLDASRTLRSLRDRDYLELHGSGKNSWYGPGKIIANDHRPTMVSFFGRDDDHNTLMPQGNELTSQAQDLMPQGNELTSQAQDLMPQDDPRTAEMELRRVQIATSVASGRRSKPELVAKTILLLCETGPLTVTELSSHLRRDRYTIGRYVRQLVEGGFLNPTRSPRTHPDQTYISAEGWRSRYREEDTP
jgi:ATP-dependent DNA helicase RecG